MGQEDPNQTLLWHVGSVGEAPEGGPRSWNIWELDGFDTAAGGCYFSRFEVSGAHAGSTDGQMVAAAVPMCPGGNDGCSCLLPDEDHQRSV